MVEQNNIFDSCVNVPETRGTVPSPPYAYALDNPADIPTIVQNGAGRAGYVTSIAHNENDVPVKSYQLYQNYPNPFNPVTNFGFRISDFGFVSLKIYDITGREVATIVSEKLPAGSYEYQWDARGFASGVYFYQLEAKGYNEVKKMTLMK
ncbi:MAG: T9SS type A sorting domain-containing protein [Aliifodinibius sp.]|nr:T9SS type A sorting domain-containing protein [Fodinibius sp.]NIW47478.1 T9SS type A sorting domain-containing protein [Gammaproteobacteria bacterium]NIX57915.1 T9SS type A sorting domain-containing protein [candidate division Zixibacteria bacterium]NIY27930.1 T9SS type A sorting domain-containing protein [Fodinibius sp.]